MLVEQAERYVADNRDRFLSELFELLRIPSISGFQANPEITRCGELLVRMLRDLGAADTVMRAIGIDPIITGSIGNDPEKQTVLVYGHFDVRPVEPLDEWHHPPFEPHVADGRIFGRGSGDNKGQLLAHLKAVEFFRDAGRELPVNVRFVLDGGEETGMKGLAELVRSSGDNLSADVAYASDGSMQRLGVPQVVLGTKGSLNVNARIRTLRKDVHGGYCSVLPNAAHRLIHLLAGLVDPSGRVLIPGFYDDVAGVDYELEPLEHELQAHLAPGESLTCPPEDCHRRLMFAPGLNVDVLHAGCAGVDSQNIVPAVAEARLKFLLVPDQNPADILSKLRAEVVRLGYDENVLTPVGSIGPSRTAPDNRYVRSVCAAVEQAYGKMPVIIHSYPSAGPGSVFTSQLKIPAVYVPYAQPDESNHAPNENLRVDHFLQGVVCSIMVFQELGRTAG